MQVRIYQTAKSAMTSGRGNTGTWMVEPIPDSAAGGQKAIDPLMGWTGSTDTQSQVRLRFDTKNAAIEYAERNGYAYVIETEKPRRPNVRPMGYAGNFAHNRRGAWTH